VRTRIEPPPLPYLERLLRFGSVDDRGAQDPGCASTGLHRSTSRPYEVWERRLPVNEMGRGSHREIRVAFDRAERPE
jgi:hypothetical protein